MGMLLTLYLISTNVYISVDAPTERGFSYIEFWFVGMQSTILLAIIEYSIILGIKKYWQYQNEKDNKVGILMVKTKEGDTPLMKSEKENITILAYKMDVISLIMSIVSYLIFCMCYWLLL